MHRITARGGALIAAVLASAGLALTAGPAAAALPCTGDGTTVNTLVRSAAPGDYGLYVLPTGAPKGIVAVGHGYPSTAHSVESILKRVASEDGVIAFAMDYRGTVDVTPTQSRGWKVIEGAQDTIDVARQFQADCGVTGPIVAYGISMGGNAMGLAVSQGATRIGGGPLWDYFFDVAGVTNPLETYADATAISLAPVGSIQQTGINAKADLEAEFGNPILNLGNYLSGSPWLRAGQMKSSGVKGVVISHGVLDGEVTSDQSVQMALTLALTGMKTDIMTSVFKAPGSNAGLTLDGDVLGLIPGYQSPFAGHVNQIVQDAALNRLAKLYATGQGPTGTSLTLVDGNLGTIPLLP